MKMSSLSDTSQLRINSQPCKLPVVEEGLLEQFQLLVQMMSSIKCIYFAEIPRVIVCYIFVGFNDQIKKIFAPCRHQLLDG